MIESALPEQLVLPSAFRFDALSPELQAIKHALFSGYMAQVELIEGMYEGEAHPRSDLYVTFGPTDYDDACANAMEQCFPDPAKSTGESILRLGVESALSALIMETLDAGFRVYFIPESSSGGGASGYFTLVYTISDNS